MQAANIKHNYNGEVLAVSLFLEAWLHKELETKKPKKGGEHITLTKLVEDYCKGNTNAPRGPMEGIFKLRNKFAHPKWMQSKETGVGLHLSKESREKFKKIIAEINDKKPPKPCFATIKDFTEARNLALRVEQYLGIMGETGMADVVIESPLPYDMGNAGDFIKHGALAIYVHWWAEQMGHANAKFCFADPFGGVPWGWTCPGIVKRLEGISKKSLLWRYLRCYAWGGSEAQKDSRKYYGSSYVVRRAAKQAFKDAEIEAKILASDKEEAKRQDLHAAGLELIQNHFDDYKPENGYNILQFAKEFDLILLDPFTDFLPQAVAGKKWLHKIDDACKANKNLCVMVFVLDMYYEGDDQRGGDGFRRTHEKYREWKEGRKDILCLQCPFISPSLDKDKRVEGEKFNMEILLMSQQFCGDEFKVPVRKLRDELANFAGELTEALGVEVTAR